MNLDEAISAVEIDEKSEAPRTGYVRNAKPFQTSTLPNLTRRSRMAQPVAPGRD